jgi:hypothetical protein
MAQSCNFVAVPGATAPLPGKRKPRARIERSVSQAGWKSILEQARSLRDATVFLSCPDGDIHLASSHDYALRLGHNVRAASKVLAGRRKVR